MLPQSWSRYTPLAIGALVLLVYGPALGAGFIWCDDYTVANSALMHGVAGLRRIWIGGSTEQYYPITYTVYWLVAQIAGIRPEPFHWLNVLLHAANAVLLWRLLGNWRVAGAGLAALLFALHPVQVESVAWIYELRNVLSTCLLLGTALFHARYLRGAGIGALLAAVLCFALALLAKSAVLVYPAIAFLVAPAATQKRRVLSLIPFVVLAALMADLTVWYEHHHTQARGAEWPQSFAERLSIAGQVFWFYLGKLVWPHPLAFAYRRFETTTFLPALAVVALFVVLLLIRRRSLLRPLTLYALTVFPVLGFFNIYMMRYTFVADHLAYLPYLVLMPFVAARLAAWPRWIDAAIVAVLCVLTLSRAVLFRSEERLWQQAIESGHDTWLARVNLGLLAKRRGEPELALTQFEAALAMQDTADARVDLANMLAARGDYPEAILHYERALEIEPDNLAARHSFASALARAGRLEAALLQYQRILARDPTDSLALRNRDSLLRVLNR